MAQNIFKHIPFFYPYFFSFSSLFFSSIQRLRFWLSSAWMPQQMVSLVFVDAGEEAEVSLLWLVRLQKIIYISLSWLLLEGSVANKFQCIKGMGVESDSAWLGFEITLFVPSVVSGCLASLSTFQTSFSPSAVACSIAKLRDLSVLSSFPYFSLM